MKVKITGIMVYYYFVCKKKLWYFLNNITMEHENEDVLLGRILDETTYSKSEKHICIDETINIDFIKNKKEIHEIKKSKSIEEASIWQVKYYLYYLKKKGVYDIKARIDYPLLKECKVIKLEDQDEAILDDVLVQIENIYKNDVCPVEDNKKICKKCAYYELCFI